MNWRFLQDEAVSHVTGLAVDDALAQLAAHDNPVTLRLYTYSPCALIGRFQHLADEINLDFCHRLNIPVNRRPTGGGAIIMGPDQLGVALVVPPDHSLGAGSVRQVMERCAGGVIEGLSILGIDSQLFGKNDLVVAGRKIAGLGLYRAKCGAVLFHASVLLDLDIPYMLDVLRTAFDRTSQKYLTRINDRLCTVRTQAGNEKQMHELKEAIKKGYQDRFAVKFTSAVPQVEEQALSEKLEKQKYSTQQWIFNSPSRIRDSVGGSQLRTAGGMLEVRAIVAGQTIKSVCLGGDFIASDNAVLDLEGALRWHIRDDKLIRKTVFDSVARYANCWHQISPSDVANAVTAAVEQSFPQNLQTQTGACFARGAESG